MWKRVGFIGISIIVSALLIVLVMRDVPVEEVITNLRTANILWLIICVLLMGLGFLARAVRWRGLLGFKIPTIQAFYIMSISFFLNLLPFRIGEIARSALATRHGVPFVTAATSVVVERLVDTLLAILMLAWSITQIPTLPPEVTAAAQLFGIVGLIGFIVLVIFARYPNLAYGILDFVQGILPFLERLPLRTLLEQVIDGLQPLTSWRSFGHVMLWSIISWVISFFSVYTLFRSLPINPEVDLLVGTMLGMSLAAFSIAIPVTVAGIGPFEAAVLATGNAIGMVEPMSIALGFLFHGIVVIGYVLYGVIGIFAMGVSVGELLRTNTTPEQIEATQT